MILNICSQVLKNEEVWFGEIGVEYHVAHDCRWRRELRRVDEVLLLAG